MKILRPDVVQQEKMDNTKVKTSIWLKNEANKGFSSILTKINLDDVQRKKSIELKINIGANIHLEIYYSIL